MRSKKGLSSPFTTMASVLSWAEAGAANSSTANAANTPAIFMDVLLMRIGGSRRPPGATIGRFGIVRIADNGALACPSGAHACPGRRSAATASHAAAGAVASVAHGRLRQLTARGGMRLIRFFLGTDR